MSSFSRSRCGAPGLSILAALLCLACAGCAPSPQAAGPATALPAEEAAKEAAQKYAIQYPQLAAELAPLDQAMHSYADVLRKHFDRDIVSKTDRADNAPPPHLSLEFAVATHTQDFVSATAIGEIDRGDLHPTPLQASFTQHLPSGKIVALSDLFNDADAMLKTLSDESRRRLEAQFEARLRQQNLSDAHLADSLKTMRTKVEEGTEPSARNFANFLIDGVDGKAFGISLQFAADQVAAATDGPQQLVVPARVFYNQLKSDYRDAFAVDAEDIKAAATQNLDVKPADAKPADAKPAEVK